MKFYDKILSYFKPRNLEQDSVKSAISSAFQTYHSKATISDLETLLQNWVFVCVDRRAKSFSGLKTYSADSNQKYLPETHWLSLLMKATNRYYSFNQLRYLISCWLDITGNAFVYCETQGQKVVEMYCLPVELVTMTATRDGAVYYDVRLADNQIIRYTNENVIHLKTIKPSNNWELSLIKGSPLAIDSIADVILSDKFITKTLKETAEKGGVTPFTLVTENTMSKIEFETFKQHWQYNLAKYPVVALLENGMEAKPILGQNPIIPNNVEDMIIKRVSAAFDIPPKMLTNEYNAEATAKVIEKSFYTRSIIPHADFIFAELNKYFNRFGVGFVYDNPLLTEPEEKRKEYEFLLSNGLISINEIRGEYGFESIPGGDTILIRNQLQTLDNLITPINENNNEVIVDNNSIIEDEKHYSDRKELISELEIKAEADYEAVKKTFNWHKYNKITERYKAQMDGKIAAVFSELKNEFKSNLLKDKFEIDTDYWSDLLYNSVTGVTKSHCKAIAKQAIQDVNLKPETIESSLDKVIKDSLADTALKVRETTTTISAEIMGIAKKVAENQDLSEAELTRRIKQEIGSYIENKLKNRINLISRTATTAQRGITQKSIWQESGYETVWLSTRDSKVRDSHSKADGQKPNEEGYYQIGLDLMMYPASGQIAAENCNCRCMLYPKVKDK